MDDLKETALIMFSSGTTGLPKGLCLNHLGILLQTMVVHDMFRRPTAKHKISFNGKEAEVCMTSLSYASLYWISTVLIVTGSIMTEYTRLLMSKFDKNEAWRAISKYKVTWTFMAPCQLIDVARSKPSEDVDVSSLTQVLTGGSAISGEQIKEVKRSFKNMFIAQGCGQTEVSGIYTGYNANIPKHVELAERNPSSCGMPMAGILYKVIKVKDFSNFLFIYFFIFINVYTSVHIDKYKI